MQRSTTHTVIAILTGVLGLLFDTPASAQYTSDYQTNIISGVVSNWSGDYDVGTSNYADVLLIQRGGILSNDSASVGLVYGEGSTGSNVVIVSGSGSVWNNSGGLNIGDMSDNNQLIITNGGALYSVGASVGGDYSGLNTVLVTGPSSVWSNTGDLILDIVPGPDNSLIIADGAAVYNSGALWAGSGFPPYGALLVTGTGSVLNTGTLYLDGDGFNTMTVTNGAVMNSGSSYISGEGPDSVVVTGNGSVWNSGFIEFSGEANSLNISAGGAVYSAGALFQVDLSAEILVTGTGSVWYTSLDSEGNGYVMTVSNSAMVFASGVQGEYSLTTISGGSLYVTNGLNLGDSQFILNSGTVDADSLNSITTEMIFANFINFNGGTLITESTTVSNGWEFIVGNGTNTATFQLAGGGSGIHSFANGLTISSNAFLTGCGTIEGSLVVNPGGTVVANCGGTLTFTGIVTNNGTMQALNGSVLEGYGNLVNNGIIDIRGGTTNFPGGFINNGIVITTNNFPVVTAIQAVGPDVEISVHTGNGSTYVFEEATNLSGGNWTPVIEFTGTGGVITFIDPGAATLPQRFYRVGLIPSP